EAARLRDAFRTEQMRQLPLVEQAMGRQALALLGQLDAACHSADDLEQAAIESFNQHPDADIITSFPGLGALTGARVLGEIGDDRARFADAKGLKAYAGRAPGPAQAPAPPPTPGQRPSDSRPPAPPGGSPPPPPPPPPARTTTAGGPPETGTPPPSGTCSTGSSAACTTAWPPASTTTR